MNQCHVFVLGFVQGVGFRHFVRSKASELGLTGWVRNVPGGSVEAVFQGPKEKIEKIIKDCKNGPFLSEVQEIKEEWEKLGSIYKSFEIL